MDYSTNDEMDFDLDMEFVPNMEFYQEDSDDDIVNEEIIAKSTINTKIINKKKTNNKLEIKNCDVCENPNTINVKLKTDGFFKEFEICRECKSNIFHLFEMKLLKLVREQNLSVPPKKRIIDLLKFLISNSVNKDENIEKINIILNEIINNYKHECENYIPFENIKVLDSNNVFCCFTTRKRMNKFISEGSVDILSDKIIRWKYPRKMGRNQEFQIKEEDMKENKCFCCDGTQFLKSLSIFPEKKNLSIFLRDNVLIHFFFAFCSKCRNICDKNRDICNDYFYSSLNKYSDEYIEELYQQNQNEKVMKFVQEYILKFKDFC